MYAANMNVKCRCILIKFYVYPMKYQAPMLFDLDLNMNTKNYKDKNKHRDVVEINSHFINSKEL